jgi:N-acetylmuramoyl-L-alanine amidase
MNITEQILTKNKYSRPCTLLKAVKGIVVHWVANPGSSAIANRNYFEGLKNQVPPNNTRYASAHYVIGLEGEIIRCVPDREVCYHVGAEIYANEALRRLSSYPNNCTIGIELCHPAEFDSAGHKITDPAKWKGKFTAATLQSCRELAASLLVAYGLGKDDLWRHYDVTTKVCPKYFVEHTDEWDAFRASVMEVKVE